MTATVTAEEPDGRAPAVTAQDTLRTLHAAWGAAVAALAALALLFAGEPPPARLLAALFLAAAPGLLALAPLRRDGPDLPLALWTLGAGLAVALGGGLTGPLAALAVAPALAGLAFGAWLRGAAGACLVAGVVSVLQSLGRIAPDVLAPADAAALASGVIAVVALGAAFAASLGGPRTAPAPLAAPAPAAPGLSTLRAELAEAHAGRERAEGEARARARFLAEMSHELRTPLNAIVGFSDIMRTRLFGPLSDRYGEYAELIHQSGEHLTALINDVLDMSKIDADRYELRRELFDAREPVGSALILLRTQADAKGVALHAALPGAPLTVDADPRALKQIALNLLANALKFTPAGGEVTLSLAAAGAALELTVADTGVGIAPDDLERLGRPYAQADAGRATEGTGLGLSLVKAFARLHGGELTLESRLGEGTAATVRLPVLV